ncbi:hypothetical protein ECANGB1_1493 [Enterospora canceri]|uniref:Uncharacterized protein n=1 Tax=Enterospora canceri TaxID=1081671 RepID=A0A1Y1S6Q0_9MICR|nr:hypothetical protein ECANGB1_1493 [Enterospora canceri]
MDASKLHGQYFVLPTKNKYVITFQEDGMRYLIGMSVTNYVLSHTNCTDIRFHKIHFTTDGISSLIITKYTTHKSNSILVLDVTFTDDSLSIVVVQRKPFLM